jgi:hypothetical protein
MVHKVQLISSLELIIPSEKLQLSTCVKNQVHVFLALTVSRYKSTSIETNVADATTWFFEVDNLVVTKIQISIKQYAN